MGRIVRLATVSGGCVACDDEVAELQDGGSALSKQVKALAIQAVPPGGPLWVALEPVVIANTDVDTSQFAANGYGSLTLPGNFFKLARKLRIETRGVISALNGQVTQFRIKLGDTDLINVSGTLPNGLSNDYIESIFDLTCYETGANGRVRGSGRTIIGPATGSVGPAAIRPLNMTAEVTLDTRLPYTLDYRYKWTNASASNNCTIVTADVRALV